MGRGDTPGRSLEEIQRQDVMRWSKQVILEQLRKVLINREIIQNLVGEIVENT